MKTPESGIPALTFKTGFDNSRFLPSEQRQTGYYYAEAKAIDFQREGNKRTPLNLSLVIDRSGSMGGAKLAHAKLAAQYVVDQLGPEDYVSIVQYDDQVEVVATANRVGDKQLLRRQIESIRAGGSTNLGGGMLEGYSQVKRSFKQGYVNRVLLLSDGLANVGITNEDELQRIAKNQNLENGITISTFGLGLDYNENLMTNIAEYGSGNYYFIREPEEISSIFQRELQGLLTVVAQDAILTITLPQEMVVERVFGYPFQQSGNRLVINFRDVMANETKAVMVKFSWQGNGPVYAVQASLSYQDVTGAAPAPRLVDVRDELVAAAGPADFEAGISEAVKAQVVLFESNDRLEEAMREVDRGNYEAARQAVAANAAYMESNMIYVEKSEELQAQMSSNASYQGQIREAEQLAPSALKSIQKAKKSMNYDTRKKR